jgi:hypothetical protein
VPECGPVPLLVGIDRQRLVLPVSAVTVFVGLGVLVMSTRYRRLPVAVAPRHPTKVSNLNDVSCPAANDCRGSIIVSGGC